jgi:hypothetical protein
MSTFWCRQFDFWLFVVRHFGLWQKRSSGVHERVCTYDLFKLINWKNREFKNSCLLYLRSYTAKLTNVAKKQNFQIQLFYAIVDWVESEQSKIVQNKSSGHRIRLRNRRLGFESRQGTRFLGRTWQCCCAVNCLRVHLRNKILQKYNSLEQWHNRSYIHTVL